MLRVLRLEAQLRMEELSHLPTFQRSASRPPGRALPLAYLLSLCLAFAHSSEPARGAGPAVGYTVREDDGATKAESSGPGHQLLGLTVESKRDSETWEPVSADGREVPRGEIAKLHKDAQRRSALELRQRHRRARRTRRVREVSPSVLWGGGVPVPRAPTTTFYTPMAKIVGRGPCRSRSPVKIFVTSYNDVIKRVRYPPTVTVVLVFQNGFALPRTLVLARNFSCTFFVAARGKAPLLSASWSTSPAVLIYATSNIVMHGISVRHGISSASRSCSYFLFTPPNGAETKTITCPGFYILRSFGIQIGQASIYGRIDVFRSWYVKLDSLKATTAENAYDKGKPYRNPDTHGVIRMGRADNGSNFVASNNVISNCEVYGHWELITLYFGAVGVTVRNNYLHHFLFPAIRCGANEGNTFDCFLNYIGYNYIWNPPSWRIDGNPNFYVNNAGIYLYTHWFNPGNFITCNYIENQVQCIYLDSATSGVTVVGGVCHNTYVGMKVNNGKFNNIQGVLMSNCQAILSQVTCVVVTSFNFYSNPLIRKWEGSRRTYYNTPEINAAYPFMHTMADPVPDSFSGVNCNSGPNAWPASRTGKCSGLAYGNTVDVFAYNPPPERYPSHLNPNLRWTFGLTPYDEFCDHLPAMPRINSQKWHNVTDPRFRFKNPKGVDFGLLPRSGVLKVFPNFKVCPRAAVGPKAVPFRSFEVDFNIPWPRLFGAMLNFKGYKIVEVPR